MSLRVALGLIFLMAGWAKLSAGPAGFAGALAGIGFPASLFLAWVVALVEVVAGAMLVLGVYARWASVPLGVISIVAMFTKWAGNFGTSGFMEFTGWRLDLLMIVVALAIYYGGSGKWSLDKAWRA